MSMFQLDLTTVKNHELRGRILWVDHGEYETILRVPKGARCTMWKRGAMRTVNVGGVSSITCTISGRADQINPLWAELRE